MTHMVRKQFYIADSQERRLKRRARELGVREAELVRRALEAALDEPASLPKPDGAETVSGLLATIDRLSRRSGFPVGWKFSRAEIYGERERGHGAG